MKNFLILILFISSITFAQSEKEVIVDPNRFEVKLKMKSNTGIEDLTFGNDDTLLEFAILINGESIGLITRPKGEAELLREKLRHKVISAISLGKNLTFKFYKEDDNYKLKLGLQKKAEYEDTLKQLNQCIADKNILAEISKECSKHKQYTNSNYNLNNEVDFIKNGKVLRQ